MLDDLGLEFFWSKTAAHEYRIRNELSLRLKLVIASPPPVVKMFFFFVLLFDLGYVVSRLNTIHHQTLSPSALDYCSGDVVVGRKRYL